MNLRGKFISANGSTVMSHRRCLIGFAACRLRFNGLLGMLRGSLRPNAGARRSWPRIAWAVGAPSGGRLFAHRRVPPNFCENETD